MHFLHTVLLLVFACLLDTYTCLRHVYTAGTFYEQVNNKVSQQSVSKRLKNKSPASCILQCSQDPICHLQAIEGSDCLFLDKGFEEVDERDMVLLITLKEIDISKTHQNTAGNAPVKLFFLHPHPRTTAGTSLFCGLPRSPYHFIFPLLRPI